MAVVNFKPIQFGPTMQNNASGEHATTSAVPKPGKLTNDDLGLYRSDNRNDRQKFLEQMPNINPAYDSMSNVGSGIDESGHVYQYLNPYRTCDIIIGSQNNVSLDDTRWGNWRRLEPNEPSTQIVPDNVVLTLDDPKIGFQFTHQVESAFQGLQDKSFLKNVSGMLEVARLASITAGDGKNGEGFNTTGRFQSRFAKVPAWKDTSALQVDAALTFKFSYGQFGWFSGEWEVVRPILALAHHFSLRFTEDNYVQGPAPTQPAYLMGLFNYAANSSLATDIASSLGNAAKSGVSAIGSSMMQNKDAKNQDLFKVVESLTDVEKRLYNAMDVAISNTMTNSPLCTIALRVGRLVVGSIFVKNIRWSFDYANLDEYGYPCHGEITLSDLEMIYYPMPWTFMNVFDIGSNQKFRNVEEPTGGTNGQS